MTRPDEDPTAEELLAAIRRAEENKPLHDAYERAWQSVLGKSEHKAALHKLSAHEFRHLLRAIVPAVATPLLATNAELLAQLEAAEGEIAEAADKMHVLGINHPGGSRRLDEDKAFMAELARRFMDARDAVRAAIAKAKGEAR